jgi:hypothetical protein
MSASFTLRKATYTSVVVGTEQGEPWFHSINSFCKGALPDLEDAATIGCLLALVREARQEPWYYPTAQVYGGQVLWLVERPVSERQTLHESEASALVAALEAAP